MTSEWYQEPWSSSHTWRPQSSKDLCTCLALCTESSPSYFNRTNHTTHNTWTWARAYIFAESGHKGLRVREIVSITKYVGQFLLHISNTTTDWLWDLGQIPFANSSKVDNDCFRYLNWGTQFEIRWTPSAPTDIIGHFRTFWPQSFQVFHL